MLKLFKNQEFVKSFTLPHTHISQIDLFKDFPDGYLNTCYSHLHLDRTFQIADLDIYCGLTFNDLGVS